ncbi:DUF1800 domain-containing protein [Paracoccus onubensis]|uniref:DUF1800 domain-containing protein n=1 Tax=Paracoccus onubensis TaxID=1675788 RepID=A0A418T4N1_9RHOB|nr:DUF1800 domain-containing protein [Paracoccus onubensis]RJE88136.1 DUF1800 domain-containing protein [Paracoccus onubensis]
MATYPELAAIRLGYGLSAQTPPPAGQDEVLASVKRAVADADGVTMAAVRKGQSRLINLAKKRKNGDKSAPEAIKKQRQSLSLLVLRDTQRRFARAVDDPAGFGERLVQFWADHFTVGGGDVVRRVMVGSHVNEAIRPHIGGRFADLMFAAETHPCMLVYLNQNNSVGPNSQLAKKKKGKNKPGLNENLAREMIELHSLGVGAEYTQKDVRQLAKLLTGLTYSPGHGDNFRAAYAEPGKITVLGQSYRGDGPPKIDDIRAVIEDLSRHPATAQHLSRKLVTHFISDDPPQSLVDRLAGIYADSDGDLSAVNAALADSPELAGHFREKVKQPFEFIVASLRGLGVTGEEIMGLKPKQVRQWLEFPLTGMGQKWGRPAGPDGWPEAADDWITPQGLAARIEWAMNVPQKFRKNLPDPRQFMQTALGETASEPLQWAVPKAETTRDGIAIVLASVDFNRR